MHRVNFVANWARLVHKIFEVDPWLCPNCGKELDRQPGEIIAFITSHQEIKKILKHIGEETQRAPPLLPSIPSYEEDSYDWGDFPLGRYADAAVRGSGTPPDEAYFCDAQWGL